MKKNQIVAIRSSTKYYLVLDLPHRSNFVKIQSLNGGEVSYARKDNLRTVNPNALKY